MIQLDEHIFQLGWFNHQEVRFSISTGFFCWISSFLGVFFLTAKKPWRKLPDFRDEDRHPPWDWWDSSDSMETWALDKNAGKGGVFPAMFPFRASWGPGGTEFFGRYYLLVKMGEILV